MKKTLITRTIQAGCIALFAIACNRDGKQDSVKPVNTIDEASIALSIAEDQHYLAYQQAEKALYISIEKGLKHMGLSKVKSYAELQKSGRLNSTRMNLLTEQMPNYKAIQLSMTENLNLLSDKYALKGKSPESLKRIFTVANKSFMENPGSEIATMDCPCNPDPGWEEDEPGPEDPGGEDGGGNNDTGGGTGGTGGPSGGGGYGGWTPPAESVLKQSLKQCYRDDAVIAKAIVQISYCTGATNNPRQCVEDHLVDAALGYISCVLDKLVFN